MADAEKGIPGEEQNPNKENHGPILEYKCPADEAWYQASFKFKNGVRYFKIHYRDTIPKGEIEEVDLQNSTKVEDTIKRLRRLSKYLEDHEYHTVKEGMVVCATHKTGEGDNKEVKHFDAIVLNKVKKLQEKEKYGYKSKDKEKDKDIWSFEVEWKDGPSKGQSTRLRVGDICWLRQERIENHRVIQFLQSALEKNKKRDEGDVIITSSNVTVVNDKELKSSPESETNVGSSHRYKNDSLPPDAASTSDVPGMNLAEEAPLLDLNTAVKAAPVTNLNVLLRAPRRFDLNVPPSPYSCDLNEDAQLSDEEETNRE